MSIFQKLKIETYNIVEQSLKVNICQKPPKLETYNKVEQTKLQQRLKVNTCQKLKTCSSKTWSGGRGYSKRFKNVYNFVKDLHCFSSQLETFVFAIKKSNFLRKTFDL